MVELEIKRFPNREFSFFCEFKVAFELQKRGWQVYQPLIDRYIDLIAVKNGNYRTLQVKSSRIENSDTISRLGYESYGLTMEPKDLFHDIRHFYIWVFIDKDKKFHYFIFSVKDFIDIRFHHLPQKSRRKHPSLLMRGEWRHGTDRLYPPHYVQGEQVGDWDVERVLITKYERLWEKLESAVNIDSYNIECIKATEMQEMWKSTSDEVLKSWRINNEGAKTLIKKYPDVYESSKKLLKERIDDVGIMDAHLIRLTEEEADRIFKETEEKWEVFLPMESTDHVLLFRPICATCGTYWDTSYKECFHCKTQFRRIKACENCNKPYVENVSKKQKCNNCGNRIVRKCIKCGEIETRTKTVFVPITFCWYCGNRQNKFKFKRIPIGK